MKDLGLMKRILLQKDPTYTQEELDGMTADQLLNAYNDLMATYCHDPEDRAWRMENCVANNL